MNRIVVCPLCGTKETELLTNKIRFGREADVRRCGGCGMVFVDQGSFEFPRDFYEKEYHQTYITHVEPDALNPRAYYEKMKKSTKIWADKFSIMLTGKETVLDIGCSTGHFMDMVKDKTAKIYGSDLNIKEIQFCRDELKLDVSDKPLKERFSEDTFDYITMIYVLEHIADPKGFMKAVTSFLKPHGKLVILVPNVRDALVNFYDIPEFKSFYYCIEHLFYYSQSTLRLLFDSLNLKGEIEVVQEYPLSNHINWAYRRGPSDTLASRMGVPDMPLSMDAPSNDWNNLWERFNYQYRKFLLEHGYGDKLWCVVGKGK